MSVLCHTCLRLGWDSRVGNKPGQGCCASRLPPLAVIEGPCPPARRFDPGIFSERWCPGPKRTKVQDPLASSAGIALSAGFWQLRFPPEAVAHIPFAQKV